MLRTRAASSSTIRTVFMGGILPDAGQHDREPAPSGIPVLPGELRPDEATGAERHGEAQAAAVGLGREERAENLVGGVGRHARALVVHVDHDPAGGILPRQPDRTTVRRGLDGIARGSPRAIVRTAGSVSTSHGGPSLRTSWTPAWAAKK